MRVAIFSSHKYDQSSFEEANSSFKHELVFFTGTLESATASLAAGFPAVCSSTIASMHPSWHRGWLRVREDNFSLESLVGRDLHGKTVGVIGTGRIGALVATAFKLGFDWDVVAHDVYRNPELEKIGIRYVEVEDLLRKADIVCLHCPLSPQTRHLINEKTLALAKPGFLLVNSGRGALVDTKALIDALKSGKVGGVAMEVYEQESDLFFEDLSNEVVKDDVFQRPLTFPNVIVTGHQAFFTREALAAIAQITLQNIADLEAGRPDPARLVKAANKAAVACHVGMAAFADAGAGGAAG